MPRLSITLIRAALIHMGIGFLLGALMLFNKAVPFNPALWALLPLHIEVVLIGWVVQLAMGVAYWILPRWNSYRGNVRLVAAAFVLINLGVLLVGASAWLPAGTTLRIVGRAAEVLAVIAFALHAWPRIKPPGA
jgi:hypothetical protein